MAVAVAEGARNEGIEAELKDVESVTASDFISADAIAFGSEPLPSLSYD